MDLSIQAWLTEIRTPWLEQVLLYITCLGSPQVLVALGCLTLIYCYFHKQAVEGIVLNICLLTSWVAVDLLKLFFGRSRPEGETFTVATGYSFPSGHATLSMAFYGFIAYLLVKKWPGEKGRFLALALYITVLLIGISRVYLNVHYASDVLAGYFLGGLSLFLFIKFLHWAKKKN